MISQEKIHTFKGFLEIQYITHDTSGDRTSKYKE